MPIISKKHRPEPMTFRWDPALLADLKLIAKKTGRSLNEVAETLMHWAVQEARRDLAAQGIRLSTPEPKREADDEESDERGDGEDCEPKPPPR